MPRRACARASAGNPFVLRELIFDLAADGVAPVAAQAARVAERVPDQVERTVLARLRRLDAAAAQLAEAVAVLGEGTGLRLAAFLVGIMLLLPWMLSKLMAYTTGILGNLSRFAH